jgi:hypothetical protein
VVHDEGLVVPLLDRGLDLDVLAVGSRVEELALHVEHRRADDAALLFGDMPAGNAAGDEEFAAGGIEPGQVVGEENDLGRIAFRKRNAVAVDVAAVAGATGAAMSFMWRFPFVSPSVPARP